MTAQKDFIVGIDSSASADPKDLFERLVAAADGRPDVSIAPPPSGRVPTVLRMKATDAAAAELMREFEGRLIIEPDAPLRY